MRIRHPLAALFALLFAPLPFARAQDQPPAPSQVSPSQVAPTSTPDTTNVVVMAFENHTEVSKKIAVPVGGKTRKLDRFAETARGAVERHMVAGRVPTVDRSRLDDALEELQFAESGLVDSATTSRLGAMLGAKLMVCGTIHSFQQLTSLKFESTGKKKPRRVRVDTLDVGFTDLVKRPTARASELRRAEYHSGMTRLEGLVDLLDIKGDALCLREKLLRALHRLLELLERGVRQACEVAGLVDQHLRFVLEALDLVVDLLQCACRRQHVLHIVGGVVDDPLGGGRRREDG